MSVTNKNMEDAFNRWLNNEATKEDIHELKAAVRKADDKELHALLEEEWNNTEDLYQYTEQRKRELAENIVKQYPAGRKRSFSGHRIHFLKTAWFRYAAAVIMLLGVSTYFFYDRFQQSGKVPDPVSRLSQDITPGKDGAILTLADGRQVVLDSLSNGVIADEAGTRISLRNGLLTYDVIRDGEVNYNTVTTPKGWQFRLWLPDGSGVWLNAGSSIRYPTAFTGPLRKVEITGEVYFEVAQKVKSPFLVSVGQGAEVEVLGTSFNINAYADEDYINTTLLEGSVRVTGSEAGLPADPRSRSLAANSVILRPGQQAQVSPATAIRVKQADTEKVMAWKNGAFNFDNANLEEVMKQLSRWYDIEVVYEEGIPPIEFYGSVGRDLVLSELLRILEISKVHFRIEDRKLIVLP